MVRNSKTKMLVQLALLLAIIILLEVTNLGYPKIGIIELSLMPIPVVIGAIICGPIGGTILGCAFGITSFLQCLGKSAFGATLLAINPFLTFVVCVVTRTLMGFLAGLIYKMFSGLDKKGWWSMAVASFSGAFLNTLFFLSALVLCFGRSEFLNSLQLPIPWSGDIVMIGDNVFLFMVAFAGVNAIFEFIATTVVGTVICKPLSKFLGKTQNTAETPAEAPAEAPAKAPAEAPTAAPAEATAEAPSEN